MDVDSTTTVYLIRHGEVDFPKGPNGEDLIYDEEAVLNSNGERQMRSLGISLIDQGIKLSVIYTSDIKRAHQSAQILGDEFSYHVPVVDIPGFRAKAYPDWERRPVKELLETGVELFFHEGPGIETVKEASERLSQAYREIVRKNRGRIVAVISHEDEIRAIMHMFAPFHTEAPGNGEGFRLTVSPEGEILDYEQVRVETSARGVEMR